MPTITYRDALNQALREEMQRDQNVILLGEDVGVDGGVFRVTEGLYKKYGRTRVIDTPLEESGIVGVSIGMAMNGLRPIIEVMTWNFAARATIFAARVRSIMEILLIAGCYSYHHSRICTIMQSKCRIVQKLKS